MVDFLSSRLRRKEIEYDEDGSEIKCSVEVSSVWMRELFGRDSTDVLRTAMRSKVIEKHIECNLSKKRSSSYLVKRKYLEDDYTEYQLSHPLLLKRLLEAQRRQQSRIKRAGPVYSYIARMQGRCLAVSGDCARGGDGKPTDPSLAAIEAGNTRMSVCDGKRLYTAVTNMVKISRRQLRIKGMEKDGPLWLVDMCAAQIRGLGLLVCERTGVDPNSCPFTCFASYGDIYDQFADLLDISRDNAKRNLTCALFDDPANIRKYGSGRALLRLFPDFWRRRLQCMGDKHEMSLALRKWESDFVLNTVGGYLKLNRPDVFFGTIHDCIYTSREHVRLVDATMKRLFLEKFGVELLTRVSEM